MTPARRLTSGLLACSFTALICLRAEAAIYQAEQMTRSGSAGLTPSGHSFAGVRLYANGDKVSTTFVPATIPGRYLVSVRGASTSSSTAGVSVYLGGARKAALEFPGVTPTLQSASFDLESSPSPGELTLVLETDNGQNDTDVDYADVSYSGPIPALPPAPRLPSEGAFPTGKYRNLFFEYGKTQLEIDAKVNDAWNKLFYGSDSDQRVYYPVADSMAYILDVNNNDVRSEGMSYGMMVAVQLDKKSEFNRLWKLARTRMYNADGEQKGYFGWRARAVTGELMDGNPAPDGEEYFVTALLLASRRWGSGTGIYNYEAEAQALLHDMLHQSDDGAGVNMFDGTRKQVVFCPIGSSALFTDPSYHLPAFYELWARWAASDREFWRAAADTSRAFLKRTTHATTGLGPDYAEFDGSPNNTGSHGEFRFDAWRTAQNIAMDFAWWAADPWETTHANRILTFFAGKGIGSYGNQFTLSGTPLATEHSPGLVAMNAVAAMACDKELAWKFVEELWNLPVPSGRYRYYDGMLYLLGLLHVSGRFQAFSDGVAPIRLNPSPDTRLRPGVSRLVLKHSAGHLRLSVTGTSPAHGRVVLTGRGLGQQGSGARPPICSRSPTTR